MQLIASEENNLVHMYIHSGTMKLLKVVVLVSALFHLTMALSNEGEQKGTILKYIL